MILGISSEARIFIYACLAGISVLAAYGILICFRKLVRHSTLIQGVEDLCFWVGASVYIFWKMYETTYGSIRGFFLFGLICGGGIGFSAAKAAVKIYAKAKKKLEKHRKSG